MGAVAGASRHMPGTSYVSVGALAGALAELAPALAPEPERARALALLRRCRNSKSRRRSTTPSTHSLPRRDTARPPPKRASEQGRPLLPRPGSVVRCPPGQRSSLPGRRSESCRWSLTQDAGLLVCFSLVPWAAQRPRATRTLAKFSTPQGHQNILAGWSHRLPRHQNHTCGLQNALLHDLLVGL